MWDSTRLCATPAGILLYDVGSNLDHRCLPLHDATSSKAHQTGISLWPPCTKLLQPSRQALGTTRQAARLGALSPFAGASGRDRRRGIFDFRCWLARESEAAEPQRGFPTR